MRVALCLAAMSLAMVSSAQFYGKYQEIPELNSGRVASNATAAGVRVDQKLKDFVPLDLEFNDEDGRKVTMRGLLKGRPVLLLPIFFKCKGICSMELNKLMESLNGMKRAEDWVGEGMDVVVFGIDPSEDSKVAKAKESTYLELYKPKGFGKLPPKAAENFSFLTGTQDNIKKFTDAIGFQYRIDPKAGIVHPAALLVLTPEGQISKYFLGNEYPTRILKESLAVARKDEIGERDDAPFFMSCISLDPRTGAVTMNVMNTIKTGGIVTLLGVIGAIVVWERKGKRMRFKEGGGKKLSS